MSDIYRGAPPHDHIGMGEEFVQHWKYVKKLKTGKTYRYFYSWDEWKAYLGGDDKKQEPNPLTAAANVAGTSKNKKDAKSFFEKVKNNPVNTIKETSNKGKAWFTNKLHPEKNKEKSEEKLKPKEEKKPEVKPAPGVDTKPGKDEKGHKYVAKIEIDGKTRYFYTMDELKAYQDREKYMAEEPDFMKQFAHSKTPFTAQEDAFNVNPYYQWNELPEDIRARFSVNCAECTAIYELRRRGYDVESNGFTGVIDREYLQYNTRERFDIMYENAKVQECKRTFTAKSTYKEFYKQIDKNPPGSRGDISVQWKTGGGHSMVWEKDLKGNIKIIDTQKTGDGYHAEYSLKALARASNNMGKGYCTVTRTDNLKLKPGIQVICMNSNKDMRSIRKPLGDYKIYDDGRNEYIPLKQKDRDTKYPVVGTKSAIANKAARIKALAAGGKTYAEIAKALGISTSTISKYLS